MARQLASRVKHETGSKITTKTPYGTTSDMVITDEDIVSKVKIPENCVLARDDSGYYFTQKDRVDNNLADGNRHSNNLRSIINEEVITALSIPS